MTNKEVEQSQEPIPGTLQLGEIHPCAHDAFKYVKEWMLENSMRVFPLMESMASCAISGNRLGEVCGETLRRMMNGEPVSDRYLLGLGWFLKSHYEESEKWLPVKGYEESYEVSNFGRIRRSSDCAKSLTGNILSQIQVIHGYLKSHLYKNGFGKLIFNHVLVMNAFIGKKPIGMVINHRDGIKTNNHLRNLEYITQSENIKHAHLLGLKTQKGEKNNASKLKMNDVVEIKKRLTLGHFHKDIAKDFNVSRQTIGQIKNGLIWEY